MRPSDAGSVRNASCPRVRGEIDQLRRTARARDTSASSCSRGTIASPSAATSSRRRADARRGSTRCRSADSESARNRSARPARRKPLAVRAQISFDRKRRVVLPPAPPARVSNRSANSSRAAIGRHRQAARDATARGSSRQSSSPSSTICRCTARSAVLIGCGSCGALITTRRSRRYGYASANASATMPPYDAPTIACACSTPIASSARATASA